MQIRAMNATFGALEQSELTLQPGLNIIYAPNESGKSTWSRFIRSMLYGVSTRDRSALADKNRYAPWSGALMSGQMEIEAEGKSYTLQRHTRRAAAPMGDFSCTFTGTATPVPGITARNAGEQLLGITPEVFARSAFISQSALVVDEDAELERRVAALITTGEEETSYSETYERLKKQLNRRRHNKTGQIPTLEREIGELDQALAHLEELRQQHRRTEEQLALLRSQHSQLTGQQRQWEQRELREIWRQYHQVCSEAQQAAAHLAALRELAGPLPDDGTLAQMENRCALLSSSVQDLRRAGKSAELALSSASLARRDYQEHPLYPADEEGLRSRIENIELPEVPGKKPFWFFIIFAVCALAAAGVTLALHTSPVIWAAAAAAAILSGAIAALWHSRRTRALHLRQQKEDARELLTQQMEEYLPLRQASQEAASQAAEAEHFYQIVHKQQEDGIASLLHDLAPYRAAATLEEAAVAAGELRRQKSALDTAEQSLRDLRLRQELMEQHLPEGDAPDLTVSIPQPAMNPSQLGTALDQTEASLRSVQTQLDTLVGQIRTMGDPDDLISRRAQKQEQLERLRREYDAIAMAMAALENANLTLQNRFSPALGARASEIFAAITGGKYHRVLLGRDFSLTAEAAGDSAPRSAQLLSQGATDQLYLSVRLAICDMVLPQEKAVPLIMDDALVTFDDQRLHAALDYLLQESQSRQILLFTCQRREADYLAGRENVNIVTL